MSLGFKRYQRFKHKKLKDAWRKPRGLHNKVKDQIRGHAPKVSIGFGTQKINQNKIVVSTVAELDLAAKSKGAVILLSSKIGTKRKVELIKHAEKMKLTLSNVSKGFVASVEEKMKSRKEQKAEKAKQKDLKHKELEKKAEKAKPVADAQATADEEKKEQEKKEKDKLLTRKEGM
jgi:large subunit ribosomal protein L32e